MPFDLPDFETDPDAVTARILDGLAERLDGWEAIEGALEVALAEEIGREIANMNQLAETWLKLAVAAMGETGFGFPAYLGSTATITVDIELNTTNVIIPAGFTVVGVNPAGDPVAFVLAADTAATATTKRVTLTATEVGTTANGVPPGPLQIYTATTMVTAATAVATSAGGADPETLEAYLDRLVDYLSTLRPGGVTSDDIAALARSVPGVARALAVDLYDPANPTVPSERTVTIFPVDAANNPVSETVEAALAARVAESREANFLIHVDDPSYTRVQIAFEVVPEAGTDPAIVVAEATVALQSWLATWGATSTNPRAWTAKNTVRHLEAGKVAGSAPGVAYVASLTINGSATDLVMSGVAALPTPLGHPTTPSTVSGSALT